MAAPADPSPWIIVAGGFHQRGGMDRANAALAAHLLRTGTPVHLVAHEIDDELAADSLARAHRVPRPRGLPGVAEYLLSRAGARTAYEVIARHPRARVVVNGGNCPWPDVNWVHAVHAAWPVRDDGAPWWSRYRNRRLKQSAQRRERAALQRARVVIANSDTTKRALVDALGIRRDRVRTVYLGSDPAWGEVAAQERAVARAALALDAEVPVVVFVGALGADINKGYDVLWAAWKLVSAEPGWDATLIVAGGGWRAAKWRTEAAASAAGRGVRLLGFSTDVRSVLAAGDLLVSPVRYEAYGLNVHEALCRGLAVMVTRTAGITERFDPGMSDSLLPADVTPEALADRLRAWRRDMSGWRQRAAPTAERLRARTWTDMAAELVGVVRQSAQGPA